jgi:hypothetical protein
MSYMCGATINTIIIVNTISGMNRIGKKTAAMNKRVKMKVLIQLNFVNHLHA